MLAFEESCRLVLLGDLIRYTGDENKMGILAL